MTRKITLLEVSDDMYPWIMGFIATMEHALKVPVKTIVKEVLDGTEVAEVQDRSTVKYMAIGGREALTALGESTIIGILFAHILDSGATGKTAKEIAADKPFNKKTIEASLWRLRHQGLIASTEI